MLVYAVGLAHFALENATPLEALVAEVAAVGTDPEAVWTLLTESRHGIDSPAMFVAGVELVATPLPTLEWYAVLVGIVVAALVTLVATRYWRRGKVGGTITIDETILLALALGTATTLLGGPLLAGAVLMPFLFGVIVRHTRLQPGWKPSYLYVAPVLAPILGIGAGLADYGLLPAELLAFVILPLAGALGLPLRATIRKRFGR
ncbi:molecular chaperone DnaJ [Natronolimnobius sp. AArcel1]|uniref:molecular chaperone DnaJ n=1 Tax=Natronolimnobius sp. AArcel1 TaxID=1679093 RepID=UPI0031B72FD4